MSEQVQSKLDADYEIILRCKKGDVEAFEEIVRKYQKKMFNIAYRMIGDYKLDSRIISFLATFSKQNY